MTLRVGLIAYGLDRPLTGISRYTVELARALAGLDADLEVTLLTAGSLGPLANSGFRVAALPGCQLLPGLMTLGNAWVPLLARRLGLDLVHDPNAVAPLLFGAGGARTVVTVHDVFVWSCPGFNSLLDTLIYRHWLPHGLPRVDAIITDSQASRQDIARHLNIPSGRIRAIPLGISKDYRPAPPGELTTMRANYRLPDRYLLFVGSVEKRKNLSSLLHAYAHLRKMGDCPPLVVVGGGRLGVGSVFETLRKLDLEKDVVFTGYVPDRDLPALYSGADLFVFPSLYEGFGLPPLEAMACGTPVITSNISSLPEVVGDAAILVDPTDVEALAEAMQRVLSDRDLHEDLRQRGLARAAGFTWERTARETMAVYREVLHV